MEKNSKRKPINIKILSLPWYRCFQLGDRINFTGLLCKCIYSDKSNKIIKFPWLEYPEPDIPGTYKVVDNLITPMQYTQSHYDKLEQSEQ